MPVAGKPTTYESVYGASRYVRVTWFPMVLS